MSRFLPLMRSPLYTRLAKPALDRALAAAGLVMLASVLGSIALLVRRRLGGPVLFSQARPGLHGRPFELIKFRTMGPTCGVPTARSSPTPTACPRSGGGSALTGVAERLGLRLVVRYGSRATGAVPPPTPESDLDLAVLAPADRIVHAHEVAAALADVFPDADLDVAVLNDADPVFLDEIFRRCDLLAGDPDLFAEWQAYAYRAFTDSADLRATERALSRRKLDLLLDAAS